MTIDLANDYLNNYIYSSTPGQLPQSKLIWF